MLHRIAGSNWIAAYLPTCLLCQPAVLRSPAEHAACAAAHGPAAAATQACHPAADSAAAVHGSAARDSLGLWHSIMLVACTCRQMLASCDTYRR
jgi:hypothetical protein